MDDAVKRIFEDLRKHAEEAPEEPAWLDLLVCAYYNVVSEEIDNYGGNTDRLVTFLQGVNALADAMISLAAEAEEDA